MSIFTNIFFTPAGIDR